MRFEGIYQKVWDSARDILIRGDGDVPHTEAVVGYMMTLVDKEGGDPSILIPAAILHDVGWTTVPLQERKRAFSSGDRELLQRVRVQHMEEGAKIARQILTDLNYPMEKVEEICHLVRVHDSWRVGKRLETRDERLIQDADFLRVVDHDGFWGDVKESNLDPARWLGYCRKKFEEWFTSKTASTLAVMELEAREREIRNLREKA